MHISHLALLDFRSYAQVDVEFEPGINVLVGRNGAGKTNLIEAIGYLASLSSHRVAADQALIKQGAERAMIRGRVVRGDRAQVIEVEIINGKANRARLNRGAPGRASDVLGILKTVVFAPEDLVLVKGDPGDRRRFLDQLSLLVSPRMAAVFTDYDRIVRQRTALLKSAMTARRARRTPDLSTLDIWDAKLAQTGAQIIALRQRLTVALKPHISRAYEQVSDGPCDAKIFYRASSYAYLDQDLDTDLLEQPIAQIERDFLEALESVRERELDRGVCLVGPHRDELALDLNGLPVKGYASHGESWSFALALRLASFELLRQGPGQNSSTEQALAQATGIDEYWWTDTHQDSEPILILDDVFAELDGFRRAALAGVAQSARQVIITAAVAQDVPQSLVGTTIYVADGEVTREPGT